MAFIQEAVVLDSSLPTSNERPGPGPGSGVIIIKKVVLLWSGTITYSFDSSSISSWNDIFKFLSNTDLFLQSCWIIKHLNVGARTFETVPVVSGVVGKWDFSIQAQVALLSRALNPHTPPAFSRAVISPFLWVWHSCSRTILCVCVCVCVHVHVRSCVCVSRNLNFNKHIRCFQCRR